MTCFGEPGLTEFGHRVPNGGLSKFAQFRMWRTRIDVAELPYNEGDAIRDQQVDTPLLSQILRWGLKSNMLVIASGTRR